MPNNNQQTGTAQNKKLRWFAGLPFGGKWAAILLVIMIDISLVAGAVWLYQAYLACGSVMAVLSPDCTLSGGNGGIAVQYITAQVVKWYAIAFAVCLLWFAASAVWRWADNLLFGGRWALFFLVVIALGELAITHFWQGFSDSAPGKITDKILWVLVLWLVVAWRGKRIKDWLVETMKKAVQEPVDSVKNSVDNAVQQVKEVANESVGKITTGLNETAESVAGSVASFSKKAYSIADDGVSKVAKVQERAISAVSEGADKTITPMLQVIKKTASDIGDGAANTATRAKTKAEELLQRKPQQPKENDKE